MNIKKTVGFFVRLLVTVGALWLAFSQIDTARLWPVLVHLPMGIVLGVVALIHLGQWASALRTRYYLSEAGIDLPVEPSLKLHYVGGLFNAFLPGGAGGDVYKAWWLKRHRRGKLFSMVKVMLATRLNGLWALGAILCVLVAASPTARVSLAEWPWAPWVTLLAGTMGYMVLARLVLREPLRQQWRAAPYSLVVQCVLAFAAYLLAIGTGADAQRMDYVILFMLSCMLAMLPVSIGGIGVRELVLLQGTRMLGLPEESGVALAFSFTVLNLSVPLVGAIVHSSFAPEKETA